LFVNIATIASKAPKRAKRGTRRRKSGLIRRGKYGEPMDLILKGEQKELDLKES